MSDLNDPRVFFAAERTLLAWNRTSLTLMAFGFVIERFGLFIHIMKPAICQECIEKEISFIIGIAFVLLGAFVSVLAAFQYKRVLATLKAAEIPEKYLVNVGIFTNTIVAVLGIVLTIYLYFSTH